MVTARSMPQPHLTEFAGSGAVAPADTKRDNGGTGQGFHPLDVAKSAVAARRALELPASPAGTGRAPPASPPA